MDTKRKIIPPFSRRFGQQLAGWTPKTQSSPTPGMEMIADLEIPLPDGTILRGDLYLPTGKGPFPLLLAWGAYTRSFQQSGLPLPINEAGDVRFFVERGYCHLTVNARGTGKSGGTHALPLSPQEQRDVADVIEWAALQPWCDGNVGMVGRSYFAMIQYFAAAQQPSALKAIAPYSGLTDMYRHFSRRGGVFSDGFFAPYFTFVGSTQGASIPSTLRHLLSYVFNRRGIQGRIDRYFYTHEDDLPNRMHPAESWMRHLIELIFEQPYDGPFYRERSAMPQVLAHIQVPAWLGTNWGDMLHLRGTLAAWASIPGSKKLVIGPADPHWPWTQYHEEVLAWYDYHLKGMQSGIDGVAAVRYWLMGADRWEEASAWPLPDTKKQRYFLASSGDDLTLQSAPGQAHTSFHAVPPGMKYPLELNRYLTQTLSYTTQPFQEDTRIVGPVKLSLTLCSSAIDTHIIARMSDIDQEGNQHILSLGWLQASHRTVDEQLSRPDEIIHQHTPEAIQPLMPYHPAVLTLSLTPTANLFKKGHRLLLEIGSRPDQLKATFFQGFVYHTYNAPAYAALNTIYHDEHSFLDVELSS